MWPSLLSGPAMEPATKAGARCDPALPEPTSQPIPLSAGHVGRSADAGASGAAGRAPQQAPSPSPGGLGKGAGQPASVPPEFMRTRAFWRERLSAAEFAKYEADSRSLAESNHIRAEESRTRLEKVAQASSAVAQRDQRTLWPPLVPQWSPQRPSILPLWMQTRSL